MTVIDTKEKKPFSLAGLDTIRQGLRVGDYSIDGFQDRVAIERKSMFDFYSTFGVERNYQRFCREMKQINEMEYGFLVVEATLSWCMDADKKNNKLYPNLGKKVLSNYIDFLFRFPRVRIQFSGGRKAADEFTVYLLKSINYRLECQQ